MAPDIANTILLVAYLGILVLTVASMWKVFQKADQPGWAALIPIFNAYVMLKIGDNPGWYLLLFIIPIANIYAAGKMYVGVAKAFGKGIGWGVGLWFLPFVFFPLLAFGDASYRGGGRGGGSAGGEPAI
ncbi:DUF5684 domain-containing protein [Halorussus sp. MSC15.2]|uniref:DUF5684 domain-containing protein n=1 Tax=Halorussus sp. MSC15.2 TaxID=2283638 RepID=UPI0013D3EA24|nr:DUF5684 domain-containing protein [Halorussus sp. MSC15.2]NEU55678.1 signal peptidase I [Halorussus sp. MSC15.2]